MSQKPKKTYNRGHYCVVTGCHHVKGREQCSFFNVKRKSDDVTELWRQRIRRENPDGSLWAPTKHSRICGCHFLKNKPSISPTDPDYGPSIFPTGHTKPKGVSDLARQERRVSRVDLNILENCFQILVCDESNNFNCRLKNL